MNLLRCTYLFSVLMIGLAVGIPNYIYVVYYASHSSGTSKKNELDKELYNEINCSFFY